MMNKRQAKKAKKKVVYPLVDEYNLIGMNEEERESEIEKFKKYCQKHYKYKHYRDAVKLIRNSVPAYFYPVPKAVKNVHSVFNSKSERNISVITQDLSKLFG